MSEATWRARKYMMIVVGWALEWASSTELGRSRYGAVDAQLEDAMISPPFYIQSMHRR